MSSLKLTLKLLNIGEDSGCPSHLILPAIIFDRSFSELFELLHLKIKLRDHLCHTRLIIQVTWHLALLNQVRNCHIKLWNHQIKILLVLLLVRFLTLLDFGKLLLKTLALLFCIVYSIFVILLNLESEILQDVDILVIKIDLISLSLEVRENSFEVLLFADVIRHIGYWSLHLSNRLCKPFQDKHSALFGDTWYKLLDLILEVLGRGGQIRLDLNRVQVEQANVSDTWQLSLEVSGVVLEQVKSVLQILNGVQQVDIYEDVDIELLVAPVDLK